MSLVFDVLTIFPRFFETPLSHGIVHQSQKRKKITIHVHNLRDFAGDRHQTTDDRPFGGGEGMILKPEPIFRAVERIYSNENYSQRNIVLLSPQGRKFTQGIAFEFSKYQQITLICGRYEGVDERVSQHLASDEISIGDYILSGGELPACVLIDAVARLLPGVLKNQASMFNESFAVGVEGHYEYPGLILDYPQYTRPENLGGLRVPELLLSGNHQKISLWRRKKALEKTLKNRPDLLQYDRLLEADKRLLEQDVET
jgi:tRNA (guanine37-N1)-methyltransferase